jgi:hypothetical protein
MPIVKPKKWEIDWTVEFLLMRRLIFFEYVKNRTNAEMKGFSSLLQGHSWKSEIKLRNI